MVHVDVLSESNVICFILHALQPELERNEFKSFDQIVAKKLTLTTNMKVAKDIK